jgi:hypothetical protein
MLVKCKKKKKKKKIQTIQNNGYKNVIRKTMWDIKEEFNRDGNCEKKSK